MELIYLATFLVAFISSILSGMAGGGGGFIMAPYWLIAGLTPTQGATTGAFMALGMGGGSMAAFRGTSHMPKSKKLVTGLVVLTLLTSAIGPFFLPHISIDVFKPILAILTVGSLPFLFINRKDIEISSRNKRLGYVLLAILLILSSFITSSAFSILMAVVLNKVLNMSILQTTVIRRIIGFAQSAVIFVILVVLGGFFWQHAVAGILGGTIGTYIGTKFAINRGEKFAKYALATGAVISSIAILL